MEILITTYHSFDQLAVDFLFHPIAITFHSFSLAFISMNTYYEIVDGKQIVNVWLLCHSNQFLTENLNLKPLQHFIIRKLRKIVLLKRRQFSFSKLNPIFRWNWSYFHRSDEFHWEVKKSIKGFRDFFINSICMCAFHCFRQRFILSHYHYLISEVFEISVFSVHCAI